jgi:hypothetical protein
LQADGAHATSPKVLHNLPRSVFRAALARVVSDHVDHFFSCNVPRRAMRISTIHRDRVKGIKTPADSTVVSPTRRCRVSPALDHEILHPLAQIGCDNLWFHIVHFAIELSVETWSVI